MNCSICNKSLKTYDKWNLYIHDTMSNRHQRYLELLTCKSCNGNDWKDERISGQTRKLTCQNCGYVKIMVSKDSPLVEGTV